MTSEADLHEGLRRVATRLDGASAPTDADGATVRRGPPAPPGTRALLAVAAVAALLVGLTALLVTDGEDESVRTDVPASEGDDPLSTAETPSTPEVPPTSAPADPVAVVPPSYEGAPWDALPPTGLAFVEGERVTLADASGQELGSFATADLPGLASDGADRLEIGPGLAVTRHPRPIETLDGCETGTGGGVRVEVCGPEQRDLVRVAPSGVETVLSGLPFDASVGRWQWAEPSPDGRWVLATWSAECEVPFAVLVPAAGGPPKTADGFDDLDGEADQLASTSWAIGWTPDGRAVVGFPEAACGSVDPAPGVYLVDPDTGERSLLRAGGSIGVVRWESVAGFENDRERALRRAAAELGLETCCGEPSHGGSGVTSGVVWEGRSIPVGATPLDGAPSAPLEAATAVDVVGVTVGLGRREGSDALALTCGEALWIFGGDGTWVGVQEQLRDLAAALIPRLYCTAGAPPGLEGG